MNGTSVRRSSVTVGVLSSIVGAAAAWLAVGSTNRATIARTLGPELTWVMRDRGELLRCEAAPAAWSLAIPGHSKVWAYDAATLRSESPAAPLLDPGIARDLDRDGAAVRFLPGAGGMLAIRVAPRGPCGVVASHWEPRIGSGRLAAIVGLSGLFAGLASAAISVFVGVRPLARRIAITRRAAARVGERDGYEPAPRDADDDLGALARELDRAHARIRADTEEMERRSTALSRHVADIAHDLRTPIASLQLALEQALHTSGDAAATRELLVRAAEDVVYLGGLTANLRLATELDDGWSHAPGAMVDLGETVERAAARLRFLAREKGVSLDVAVPDDPVRVAADPIAAEQAVANVVENAVIHGHARGHVAVMLERVGLRGFRVTVLDDGPGVVAEELPRLGERSFRSDAARRRDGRGRGLGLAISREVATRAGWTLAFAREEPTGLRVTIEGEVLS
ncbi:Phosphate regulon sensor protein PhoR (SphS) [Minicystis rosea]|nr:Phosphate regulon sensor protein PhoR (SphS) [Minicystis rosea]